jgi:fimbrial chaperone protein
VRRLLLALACIAAAAAHAQSAAPPATGIGVAPIRIDLAPGEKAAVLSVSNSTAQPVEMQARAMAWSQASGDDAHAPTDDVIVSPPRFTLDANGEQTLRVYIREPKAGPERTYRVFLDQLPDLAVQVVAPTIQFPLRLMVPMFVAGAADQHAALTWTANVAGDKLVLHASNRGARHLRISNLAIHAAANGNADDAPRLVYVLPGATRTIELARPDWLTDATRALYIDGNGDAGPFEVRVDVAR